jgi:hypothetical protein
MSWAVSVTEGNLGKGIKWAALENRSITRREALDEVQGYMVPGAVRDRKWLKEASWSLPRSLVLCTHSKGGN